MADLPLKINSPAQFHNWRGFLFRKSGSKMFRFLKNLIRRIKTMSNVADDVIQIKNSLAIMTQFNADVEPTPVAAENPGL